jgi:hypothetical protein
MEDNWTTALVGLLALVPVALYVARDGGWYVGLTALNVVLIVAALAYVFGSEGAASSAT